MNFIVAYKRSLEQLFCDSKYYKMTLCGPIFSQTTDSVGHKKVVVKKLKGKNSKKSTHIDIIHSVRF